MVLSTLEELAYFEENNEKPKQPPTLNDSDSDNVELSCDIFCGLGRGGEEEEEEEDQSDSKEEGEGNEDDMAEQCMDYMFQGPI